MANQFTNDFDNFFHDTLFGHSVEPSERVLEEIKNSLKKSKGFSSAFKTLLWVSLSLCICALAGGAYLWYPSLSSNTCHPSVNQPVQSDNTNIIHTSSEIRDSSLENHSPATTEFLGNTTQRVSGNQSPQPQSDIFSTSLATNIVEDAKGNTDFFQAFAGNNAEICGLEYEMEALLNSDKSTGKWNTRNKGVRFSSSNYKNATQDPNAKVMVDAPGLYKFTWTESLKENSRTTEVEIRFTNNKKVQVDVITNAALCGKNTGSISLYPKGKDKNLDYYWMDAGYSSKSAKAAGLYPGKYIIKISDSHRCYSMRDIIVPDSNVVQAEFTYSASDLQPCENVTFQNSTSLDGTPCSMSDKLTCTWSFGDGATSDDFYPQHSYKSEGVYDIRLTVKTEDGCLGTYSLPFSCMRNYKLQNILTPNNDTYNDVFQVDLDLSNYQGVIMSQSGEEVFRWNDPKVTWDGKIYGNNLATPGVYFYVVSGIDKNGKITNIRNYLKVIL